jgi:thiopurine S-methyltransferase
MTTYNQLYWEDRYKNNATGWDIGHISTPIKTYIDQLDNKALKILIAGAGNSYEAEYLWQQGFKNVYILDIAKLPLDNFKKRVPDFPTSHLLHQDFFSLKMTFDLVLEQTFFCALLPSLRESYVLHMSQLMQPQGKLVGLLFQFPLSSEGPPFGGGSEEYRDRFSPYFHIKTLETCYNSIKPRADKELFFIFEKK